MTISLATPCKNCTHSRNFHTDDRGGADIGAMIGHECAVCSCVQFEPDPCAAGHSEYCDHQCESCAPQSRIRCTSFPEHVGRHSHPDALGGRRFWSDDAKPWCDTCRGMVAGQCRVCGRIKNPEPVKFETKDSGERVAFDSERETYRCPSTNDQTGVRCEIEPFKGATHAEHHRNGDLRWSDTASGSPVPKFETKDSGERVAFVSGMVRDTDEGKSRFELLLPEGIPYGDQFLTRVADLMARGAEKYDSRNWEKANSEEEMQRNRSSAFRHLIQWISGDDEEDHAAAVVFNLLAHETTKWKREQ